MRERNRIEDDDDVKGVGLGAWVDPVAPVEVGSRAGVGDWSEAGDIH